VVVSCICVSVCPYIKETGSSNRLKVDRYIVHGRLLACIYPEVKGQADKVIKCVTGMVLHVVDMTVFSCFILVRHCESVTTAR